MKEPFHIDTSRIHEDADLDATAKSMAFTWMETYTTPLNLMEKVYGALAGLAVRDKETNAEVDTPPLACGRGCSWCCYMAVDVLAVEADLIDQVIRKAMHAGDQIRIRSRIKQMADRKFADHYERAKARLPCPFLNTVDRTCTIYHVRPYTCRAHHSTNVKACKQDYADPMNRVLDHQVPEIVLARALLLRAALMVLHAKGESIEFAELSLAMSERF